MTSAPRHRRVVDLIDVHGPGYEEAADVVACRMWPRLSRGRDAGGGRRRWKRVDLRDHGEMPGRKAG